MRPLMRWLKALTSGEPLRRLPERAISEPAPGSPESEKPVRKGRYYRDKMRRSYFNKAR